YLGVVGKAYVKHFTEYSEGTFLRLCPQGKNHVKMLQNFWEGDVYISVDAADSNGPIQARHPPGNRNRKLPRLALSNCRRHAFLRLELQRTRAESANNCEHCGCEEKPFYSHRPILCTVMFQSEKNLMMSIGLWCHTSVALSLASKKNRPPDERRPID